MFSLCLKSISALVRVCSSSKVLRSSFLVTCKQQRVLPLPPSSTRIPLSTALNNNRKQRGNREPTSCAPAFWTMEQEEPGNCKGGATECEGKIKLSFYPVTCSFFPCSLFQVCPFPSLNVSELHLHLFTFFSCLLFMIKHPIPFGLPLSVSPWPHFSALRTNFTPFHFKFSFTLEFEVSICLQRSHSLSHITSDKDHFSCYHGELFPGTGSLG